MTAILGLLLIALLGGQVPSDRDIALRIEDAVRNHLHPTGVTVTVQRRSALSTTFTRLELTLSGFTADDLPFVTKQPVPPSPPAHMTTPPAPPARPRRVRQLRIIEGHITCDHCTIQGLPIREMAWTLREVLLPMDAVSDGDITVQAMDGAVGTVVLDESGVTTFLRTRDLPLNDLTVRLVDGGCRVSGVTRTIIGIPVEIAGKVVVKEGAVLHMEDPKLHVSVVRLPDALSELLLKKINPLADLNALLNPPAPLTITKLDFDEGLVRAELNLPAFRQE